MKKLAVIAINYNTKDMTARAISTFLENEPDLDMEFILIDNNSDEKLDKRILNKSNIKLIKNESNKGFAFAVNQGLAESDSEYILLLNSDVLIEKNAISRMLEVMENNNQIGIIGPQIVFPDNRFQPSFGNFPNLMREFLRLTLLYKIIPGSTVARNTVFTKIDPEKAQAVDWVTGGCMLIRRQALNEVGRLDANYFLGVEDIDVCYRIKKAGWKIIYYPLAKVFHYHGYSSGGTNSLMRLRRERDGIVYFLKKHHPKKVLQIFLTLHLHNFKIMLASMSNVLKNRGKKKMTPKDATIAITYQCNSRCQMCNIWQVPNPQSLPMTAFANLSGDLRYINLSGGEPFLRPDLVDIVRTVKKASPKAKIIISSNGLATELIIDTMKKIRAIDKNIGVRISLDGNRETHNKIRGIDIYDRAQATMAGLREIGMTNLGFSFTIMNENAEELIDVYNLSKSLGIELAIALVQNSEIYFQKSNNQIIYLDKVKKSLDHVIKNELASWNIKRWGRAYYDHGLKTFAEDRTRLLKSGAGFDSLFIDCEGNIYPSNLINLKIGNILESKLEDIWNSENAGIVRQNIKKNYITESWIICTIRGELKKKIFKAGYWALKNKALVMINHYENITDQ